MRIGFMSHYDLERIGFARGHGFGSVELMVGPDDDYCPPHDGWEDRAERVKAAYADAGIRISAVAGFYLNHMDADAAEARQAHDMVRNSILLAEKMGVGCAAGFAGRIVNEPLEASLPRFKELWSAHAAFADDHGVKIAFEHCPMGPCNLPPGGINMMCTPAIWERAFEEVPSDALGLEWDASHLVGMLIDPVDNIRQFGARIHHVHAKDAKVNGSLLARYGIYHPGAIDHCFPGLGDSDWGAIIKELRGAGYDGDLNIEGWHDAVYRNHRGGPQLEDEGLLIALRHLSQYVV